MRKFKVKMVRTYTTEIEVEAECKGNLLEILNNPLSDERQQIPVTDRLGNQIIIWDELGEEELNQCNIGKEKFYVKQIAMTRGDLTSGIKPPKFKVGKYVLNEYEAREMIAKIAEGELSPKGIVLIDEDGKRITFDNDGFSQRGEIARWDISTDFALRKYRANKRKSN